MVKQALSALLCSLLLIASAVQAEGLSIEQKQLKIKSQQVQLTDSAQLELLGLEEERAAFQENFEWGTREELVERRSEFNAAMQQFRLRELRVTRDSYLATGHGDLAGEIQLRIDRLETPVQERAEAGLSQGEQDVQPIVQKNAVEVN